MNTSTQAERVRQCRQALGLSILAGILSIMMGSFLSTALIGALGFAGLLLSTLGVSLAMVGGLGLIWMKRNY